MKFQPALEPARLLRRYKRFLADVTLDSGERCTVHCPNTGAMLGCDRPGSRVWLSHSDNPRRKYSRTLEMVESEPGVLVGVHTGRTNALVAGALSRGAIPPLSGYTEIRREVRVGDARLDFVLGGPRGRCYLEVKNVTAAVFAGIALFPDAKSERARRHVELLRELRLKGNRAVMLFCVQREDVSRVRPAWEIDLAYAQAVADGVADGVEVIACGCAVSARGISVNRSIAVDIEAPDHWDGGTPVNRIAPRRVKS